MNLLYYLLSLVGGLFLTLQVGINGRLRDALGTPLLASFISFTVGALGLGVAFAVAVLFRLQSAPAAERFGQTQGWMWLGGLLGGFYVFVGIVAAPRIGFAHVFSLVVAGQILLALLFDQFGVLGGAHPVNAARVVGAALLVGGVYLIQSH